jgi:hypothetical protein
MNAERTICLQSIDTVLDYVRQTHNLPVEERWIPTEEAMRILNIKSKSTLQILKNEGKVRYSMAGRIQLFDRVSLREYIEANAKETF